MVENMEWQDLVFAVGSIVFAVALIPSIIKRQPPALSTSVMTATVLLIFTGTYVSIDYYYAAFATFVSALAWITLAAQRILNDHV